MKHRYKKNLQTKILPAILILTISISLFFVYTFYQATIEKNKTISNLQIILSNKTQTIEDLMNQIENLNLDIKTKQSLISYLSNRLQLTQAEVQGLTPVIKRYFAAAVRDDGTGTIIPFEVKLTKGTGAISINIKNVAPLTGVQDSLRIAAGVAGDYTNTNMSAKDIDITFVNEGSGIVTVDGPSAGAAMTLAIIADVQNKTVDDRVLMTGTINSDGTIGPVGGIAQKAAAARDSGARLFLVPQGQKVTVTGIEVAEYRNIVSAVSLVLK